jgi:hypothetical protein
MHPFHRFFAIRVRSLRAVNYDPQTIASPAQLALKFQAGNAGQLNVNNQKAAACVVDGHDALKFLGVHPAHVRPRITSSIWMLAALRIEVYSTLV